MLSNTCKYAIRAIIYLGIESEKSKLTGIKKIAETLQIPMPFLSKIFQNMAKNKILISIKGPNGGFGFARPMEKITLMNIIEVIDGKEIFDLCLMGFNPCSNDKDKCCPANATFYPVKMELKQYFEDHTIKEFVEEFKTNRSTVDI